MKVERERERVPSSQGINGLDGGVAVKSEKECVGCEGTAIGKYCSRSGSKEALTPKEVRPRAGRQASQTEVCLGAPAPVPVVTALHLVFTVGAVGPRGGGAPFCRPAAVSWGCGSPRGDRKRRCCRLRTSVTQVNMSTLMNNHRIVGSVELL